jgi:hypothetical protein
MLYSSPPTMSLIWTGNDIFFLLFNTRLCGLQTSSLLKGIPLRCRPSPFRSLPLPHQAPGPVRALQGKSAGEVDQQPGPSSRRDVLTGLGAVGLAISGLSSTSTAKAGEFASSGQLAVLQRVGQVCCYFLCPRRAIQTGGFNLTHIFLAICVFLPFPLECYLYMGLQAHHVFLDQLGVAAACGAGAS